MIKLQETLSAFLHALFESALGIILFITVLMSISCENGLIEYNENDLKVLQDIIALNNLQSGEPMLVDLNGNGEMDGSEPFDDLNGNGVWDMAEPFSDLNNNGIHDERENFFDLNGDGVYNFGEPFSDDNGNGVWDDLEPFNDLNENGVWDMGEEFYDWGLDGINSTGDFGEGNGIWDQESFIDFDADGVRNIPIVIDPLDLGIQHWRDNRLVYLWLSNPRISKLPGSIDALTELEELHIINTYLDSLPSEIGSLINLREIQLDYTRLVKLPKSIGNITGLKVLRVQHSFLNQVPSFVSELVDLRELRLNGNIITDIKNLNCDLIEQLEVLSIRENSICPMPESLSDTNGNGIWDPAEEKIQDANSDMDSVDVLFEFFDADKNGVWSAGVDSTLIDYNADGDSLDVIFEFNDSNNNGVWDPAEEFSDFGLDGITGTGDKGEGNNIWDFWDYPKCLAGFITDQKCVQE